MPGRVTVLCVEDEQLLLGDLVGELEDAGYRAVPARNGREAVDLLETLKPDLIICDVMMPEMDGPSLLKHIREHLPKLDAVPFIFLTARSTREDVIDGKRLGADDYLTKPIDYDLLLATIEARLSGLERATGSTREQLAKLYKAYQETQKERAPIKVGIVTTNPQAISPISTALSEVGCIVKVLPEQTLNIRSFLDSKFDVTFLVYSKKVHYLIQHLAQSVHVEQTAKIVLLVPSGMNENTKEALLTLGVDRCIEFPFRPVEIFKVVLDRLLPHLPTSEGALAAPVEIPKKQKLSPREPVDPAVF